MGYGAKIRQWREAQGWTQRQLSHQLGCTDSYVAHLEKEWKVPSDAFCRALGAVLQLTPAEQEALLAEVDETRRQRAAGRRQRRGSTAQRAGESSGGEPPSSLAVHESPLRISDREEAPGVPPEVEEAQRPRYPSWP